MHMYSSLITPFKKYLLASGCHLIRCEILIPLIDPDRNVDGSGPDKYVYLNVKLYPEAAVEPSPDISKNR